VIFSVCEPAAELSKTLISDSSRAGSALASSRHSGKGGCFIVLSEPLIYTR